MSDRTTSKRKESGFGDEVLKGLKDFAKSVAAGQPITIRDVTLELEPGEYDSEQVKVTRQKLGISQAVFAKLLAVNVKTVQAWEQGEGTHREPLVGCSMISIRILRDGWRKLFKARRGEQQAEAPRK